MIGPIFLEYLDRYYTVFFFIIRAVYRTFAKGEREEIGRQKFKRNW